MKNQMSENERKLRSRFDFSKAVRGRHADQYAKSHSVTLLEGECDMEDPLEVSEKDSQLVEIAGKHLLISRLVAAGFEVAEPLRDKGIDLIVYLDEDNFRARPVQMKASTQESFSLDRKYKKFTDLLIAYVWNVNAGDKGDVYLLTFDQALKVMDAKGYSKTDSWLKSGYYFVRSAGKELKELLKPYRMQAENLREKFLSTV